MGVGVCKIAIFVALGLGYSFPNLDFLDLLLKDVALVQDKEATATLQENASQQAQTRQAVGTETAQGLAHVPAAHAQALATQGQVTIAQNGSPVAAPVMSSARPSTVSPQYQGYAGMIPADAMPEPQGSAAVRAAQAYTDQKKNVLASAYPQVNVLAMGSQGAQGDLAQSGQTAHTAQQGQHVQERSMNSTRQGTQVGQAGQGNAPVASATTQEQPKPMTLKAEAPKPEDVSWWTTLDISSLPIPRLGVDEVAYAATLDTDLNPPPPPAAVPQGATGATPFSPPEQRIQPAGTAGPYGNTIPTYNPLVPNTNPPAPNIGSYTPPEDPTRKEQELARREQEILLLKQQMEQRLKELQAAERKVQGMLNEAKDVETSKMNDLTNMYTNMKPRQAGAAMEQLDEHIAAKILLSMRAKQAGEILSYMNPIKTAKLTEILTRMRLAP